LRVGYAEKSNSRFDLELSGSLFLDPDLDGDDGVNDDDDDTSSDAREVEVGVVVCRVLGDLVSSLRRAMSSSRVRVSHSQMDPKLVTPKLASMSQRNKTLGQVSVSILTWIAFES